MTPMDMMHQQRTQIDRVRTAVEATTLGSSASAERVRDLVEDSIRLQVCGVCVPPIFVGLARSLRGQSSLKVVSVANFPFGDESLVSVLASTFASADEGADEIDVVAPLNLVAQSDWSQFQEFVSAVVAAAHPLPIKLILEVAALPDTLVAQAAQIASAAGVRWVKTSTGFHPAGGASLAGVRLLRAHAAADVGVKASGGIRTLPQALTLLEAGADRIGTSNLSMLEA